MHPWNLNEDEAKMLQESLAADCVLEGEPDVDTVAGLDISVYPDSRIGIASSVLYSIPDQSIVDRSVLIGDLSFPYVPGLLAFREAPLLIQTVLKLDQDPDCLLVDGHGYAHPRRFGLASHLGLLLDTPSIGCAKSILVGEYDEPDNEPGDHSDVWDGEPIGYAYRTRESTNPIFVSPGHLIGLRYIPEVMASVLSGETRLPLPLHETHKLAKRERSRLENIADAFGDDQPVFLVGGGLRDLLLGEPPRDYDVLVTDLSEDAIGALEDSLSGRFFALDESRNFYRLSGENIQLDVTDVAEDEIVDDLKRRDFTINSIALDLNQESWIDPVNGREDAEDEILRPTSEQAIETDPLRILRAYRLAQYHNLIFEEALIEQIQSNAGRLVDTSKERVVEELLKLVTGPAPSEWYGRMHEDGVLSSVEFFRFEGSQDLNFLADWEDDLEGFEPFNRNVHGSYTVFDGVKAARLIAQADLSRWPFHREIKSVVSASYMGLGDDPAEVVLVESRQRLFGRVIGKAIWENWDGARLSNALSGVDRYLERRSRREKDIVETLKDNGQDIGGEKEKRLTAVLPEIWDDTVNV